MKNFACWYVLASLGAALLPGCRAKTSLPGMGNTDPAALPVPMPLPTFQITASAEKTAWAAGEPVKLAIEIKNVTQKSAALEFSSGQRFDFSATREGETDAIWSYGMNKRFIQSISTEVLEAGQSRRFETVWSGAAPGKYTISARITANGGLEAAPFSILVK